MLIRRINVSKAVDQQSLALTDSIFRKAQACSRASLPTRATRIWS